MRHLFLIFLVIGVLEVLAVPLKNGTDQGKKGSDKKRCHCHKIQKRAEREFRKLSKKGAKRFQFPSESVKKEQKGLKGANFEKLRLNSFSWKRAIRMRGIHRGKNHPRKTKESRISRCAKW